MFKKTALYRGLTCAFAIVLVIMVMLALVLEENRTMVDQTLGTKSQLMVTEKDDGTLYTAFTPDEEFLTNGKLDLDKDLNIHKNLGVKISEEGSVLLKNQNTLPLKEGAKVTVLGVRGYKSLGGRSGSFVVANGLKESGLQINPTMEAVYEPIRFSDMAPGWASNKTPTTSNTTRTSRRLPNLPIKTQAMPTASANTAKRQSSCSAAITARARTTNPVRTEWRTAWIRELPLLFPQTKKPSCSLPATNFPKSSCS